MMIDGDNPADAGTARDDAPLSTAEAATRLAGIMDDDGPEEGAKAPAPAPEGAPEADKAEPEDRDPDDWDTPDDQDAAADEEEGTEGEGADQPSEQGRFVGDDAKVKLADGRVVTVAELRSGSMMQSDYTRKTQELAETRRQVEARQAEIAQIEARVTSEREQALAILEQSTPVKPDPAMLKDDPFGYWEQKAAFDAHREKAQALQEQKTQAEQAQAAQAKAAYQERIKAELGAFLEKAPELRSAEKFQKFHTELTGTFEKAYGIKPEELTGVADHRFIFMMRDALRYQRMQANRSKSVEKVQGKPPTVMKPGRRVSAEAAASEQHQAKRARLHKTGDIRDAASIIADML
jgi:PAS domain-containing protein